jgi:hypothetical protein
VFQVAVASRDRTLLEVLAMFLGAGGITDRGAARAGWQPMSTFAVSARVRHRLATIPFAEAFLPMSAKREQFLGWRSSPDDYERLHPSTWGQGRSTCSVEGCLEPVRGQSVCRKHYYRLTGY